MPLRWLSIDSGVPPSYEANPPSVAMAARIKVEFDPGRCWYLRPEVLPARATGRQAILSGRRTEVSDPTIV